MRARRAAVVARLVSLLLLHECPRPEPTHLPPDPLLARHLGPATAQPQTINHFAYFQEDLLLPRRVTMGMCGKVYRLASSASLLAAEAAEASLLGDPCSESLGEPCSDPLGEP